MWGLRALPLLATGVLAIWPLPVSQTTGSDVLWIDDNVEFLYNGVSSVSGEQCPSQDVLLAYYVKNLCQNKIVTNAIERTIDTLFNKNFVPWKFHVSP